MHRLSFVALLYVCCALVAFPAVAADLTSATLAAGDRTTSTGSASPQPSDLCHDDYCLTFMVGPPQFVRNTPPGTFENDNNFTVLQLPDGSFRGFTANSKTYAIDSKSLDSFLKSQKSAGACGGQACLVIDKGPPGSDSACGNWLNSVLKDKDGLLYGIVHREFDCNYPINQTHMGMDNYSSSDNGLTWTRLGDFATDDSKTAEGRYIGEGGCTAFTGTDGFAYSYCLKVSAVGNGVHRWNNIALRAPVSNLTPSGWRKWDGSDWSLPVTFPDEGRGKLPYNGMSANYLSDFGVTMLSAVSKPLNGVKLSFSSDHINFTGMSEPIILFKNIDYHRSPAPSPNEMVAYPSFLDAKNGSRTLDGGKYLFYYVYSGPYDSFRRLVMRPITVSKSSRSEPSNGPRVLLALTRWRDPVTGVLWTTTRPPTYVSTTPYVLDRTIGYVMTSPHGTHELKECVNTKYGMVRFLNIIAGSQRCEAGGYTPLSTKLGWLYATAHVAGTHAIYSCRQTIKGRYSQFLSDDENCEGKGTKEWLMGYAYDGSDMYGAAPQQ